MARSMVVRWPSLGSKVTVRLSDDTNRALVDDVWQNLPFSCVQDHGVVTGEIVYCWVPMVSTAEVTKMELHSEAPQGQVSYSQGTGNKIIIKYGPATEDIGAPELGVVVEEDFPTLVSVGRRAWESTYATKDLIEVVFERGEE